MCEESFGASRCVPQRSVGVGGGGELQIEAQIDTREKPRERPLNTQKKSETGSYAGVKNGTNKLIKDAVSTAPLWTQLLCWGP